MMMTDRWLKDIELQGEQVRLTPLESNHREALLEAASDGNLWELWFTSVPSEDTIDRYIEKALRDREKGNAYPFVVLGKDGQVIGSTRYCNVAAEHKRLEIGYTWYANRFQRTGVNTECKLLLLTYAFEQLGCIAVEFRTNWHNQRSRAAISRLGAKQDGVLRNHRLDPDGTIRDTVVFSIIQSEWPAVKKGLELRLSRARR